MQDQSGAWIKLHSLTSDGQRYSNYIWSDAE